MEVSPNNPLQMSPSGHPTTILVEENTQAAPSHTTIQPLVVKFEASSTTPTSNGNAPVSQSLSQQTSVNTTVDPQVSSSSITGPSDLLGIPTRKQYYKDLSGSDPVISEDLLGVPSIKTYYPTEEEFKDPYTYIESLEIKEKDFGAVKIVPPPSWDPKLKLDLKNFKFRAVKQSLKKATSDYDEKIKFYRDLLNYHADKGTPLQRLPSIDKKVLDLYNLRNSVRAKGGFNVVCSKKMWAQIGRELGYTGRIMTSLSSSLKIAYMKILSGLEQSPESATSKDQITTTSSEEVNTDNKRPLEETEAPSNKKLKSNPEISLVTNSRQTFGRQKDILKSKGFRTTFESFSEEKPGITYFDQSTYPDYDPLFWHRGVEVFDSPYPGTDITREYNFQQFYDIHLKNSKLLANSNQTTIISEFWRIMKDKDNFNAETALDLPSRIYGSGFANTFKVEQDVSHDDLINPWNLNNLPLNEKGLLRYLPDDNDSITRTRLTVSMMHSVLTWGVEDHFLPLADYLHIGASKVWYFIHPEDQSKYEELLKQKVQEHESLVCEKNLDGFSESITNDILDGIRQSDAHRKRDSTSNPRFDKFYEHELNGVRLNSDFLISPEVLKEHDIRVHYITQRPGEFVIKFPSTYSASISLGGSLSEKVNFATINWLDHALDGGLWLENQKLLPNFSAFRLLTGILEENKDPNVLKKVEPLFNDLVEKEIALRTNLKSRVSGLKIVHNKFDYIADDTLRECFPSKIVVYDGDDSFILDPYTFLVFWCDKIKDLKTELHVFYSDDKLKTFQRTINAFAQDPSDWINKYEALLESRPKPSLVALRQIQLEGERLPFDIPEVDHLKDYINYANNWVDRAQELLACKQKNRIRNRNKSSSEIEDKIIEIDAFEDIITELESLTFTCPEIDQILEFCGEIYQYELSVRNFLNEKDHTSAEFNHMIDLGKSFGVRLNSVTFLERIANRLDWKQRVSDIVDKSTNLNDYIDLLDEGYSVGGERDDGLLTIIKQKIKNGKFLGAKVKYELTKPKITITEIQELSEKVVGVPIDPAVVQELETLKKHHTVASKQRDALYKSITENAVDLLIIRSLKEKKEQNDPIFDRTLFQKLLVRFDGTENDPRPKYSAAKEILESSKGLLPFSQTSPIDGYLRQVEEWLRSAKKLFGKPNAPFSVLKNHLQTLLDMATAPLNVYDVYKPHVDGEEENVDETSLSFCVCRRAASGIMIQCEKCSEWYHCKCMKIGRGRAKRPDDYICPICDYRLVIPREYNSPKIEDLEKVVTDAAFLELNPDELDIVRSIWVTADKFRNFLKTELKWEGNQIVETDLNKAKFYLRKLEGSSVLLLDEYNQLRHLVWKLSPVCDTPPPVIAETISKTKRIRKLLNKNNDSNDGDVTDASMINSESATPTVVGTPTIGPTTDDVIHSSIQILAAQKDESADKPATTETTKEEVKQVVLETPEVPKPIDEPKTVIEDKKEITEKPSGEETSLVNTEKENEPKKEETTLTAATTTSSNEPQPSIPNDI